MRAEASSLIDYLARQVAQACVHGIRMLLCLHIPCFMRLEGCKHLTLSLRGVCYEHILGVRCPWDRWSCQICLQFVDSVDWAGGKRRSLLLSVPRAADLLFKADFFLVHIKSAPFIVYNSDIRPPNWICGFQISWSLKWPLKIFALNTTTRRGKSQNSKVSPGQNACSPWWKVRLRLLEFIKTWDSDGKVRSSVGVE